MKHIHYFAVALIACMGAFAQDITRSMQWQDVPPDTVLSNVLDLAEGGRGIADEQDPIAMPIVRQWENYWGGSNVCWEVTNYESSVTLPKLRLLEWRTESVDGVTTGYYREVWNDFSKFDIWSTNFLRIVTNDHIKPMIEGKADKAWGKHTSAGGDAPDGMVWHSTPTTVFAGGYEYQRFAVGQGAVAILVNKGAPAYTAGSEGKFRIGDDGGTNYFGFAKSDSYTIGCDTDGISVSGSLVTLTYKNMVGGTYPVVYYTPTLQPAAWVQLNDINGDPVAGAPYTVTFGILGTDYLAFLNAGDNPQGFFKAESTMLGSATFETNMKANFMSGILCTDGIHSVRPVYNSNGTVSWQVSNE